MSKAVCLPYQARMNKNIAVYGASGSMKSRAFARNMIFSVSPEGRKATTLPGKFNHYRSQKANSMKACLLIWKMRAI